MTLPHERYGPEYLGAVVYPRMAEFVPPAARIVEIGVRPEDRGVLSREIIPHAAFMPVDRDPARAEACGGMVVDVLQTPIRADVIISTCVLHHTDEHDIPQLLRNLRAPLLMFSGPNATVLPTLFGDHRWHLKAAKLAGWLAELGYRVEVEPIGLTEPFSELLVIARRAT